MNKSSTHNSQIVIVGGGMVGAASACGLADLGLGVTLIEHNRPDFNWPQEEIDLRVSAINKASRHLLENLGAWQLISAHDAVAYREMRVWDNLSSEIHFDSADIGEPDLGHILQNRVIQRALWQAMEQRPGITILSPRSARELQQSAEKITLLLDDDTSLDTELLVAADGARSRIRDWLGIGFSEFDFQQTAVVATVRLAQGHAETAWQRFLPEGPLAFLPISTDQCSIVWSTTGDIAEKLVAMDDEAFCDALYDAVEGRLGEITETSQRARYPLRSIHAERYISSHAALVGDAAHQIHPLAGQGVNLGFRDAGALIDAVGSQLKRGRPISNQQGLRTYERTRRGDNLLMQKSMEGFNHLFSNDNSLLKLLRNGGLSATQRLPLIKQGFMQHALGTSGEIPSLCRRVASR